MVKVISAGITFVLISLSGICAAGGGPAADRAAVEQSFGSLPLYFIENQGQIDSESVAYYVKGADKTLYFTAEGITFALAGTDGEEAGRWAAKLSYLGARDGVRPEGQEKQKAVFSYFKGKPSEWKTEVPTFSRLVYRDLWPGIDLVYSGTVNELKYEFVVAPGVDPSAIRLAYEGVTALSVNEAGELQIETGVCSFADGRPYAYQEFDGARQEVPVSYTLDAESSDGPHSYGFALGDFDPEKPLIVDPAVLVYCGYIGGNSWENGAGIAVDSEGNAYVTGDTWSSQWTFPVKVGPDLTYNSTLYAGDAFVAKVNADGTGLDYCGYIGGHYWDTGTGISVDSQGCAYVTGYTSSWWDFPVKVGPDLGYNGMSEDYPDGFVAKVDAQGTNLVYCGYIGGENRDRGNGIAVDSEGNAYVTGETKSDETHFPVLIGPDLTFNGGYDAFVARVKADGTGFDYCGYIGGAYDDHGNGIAVDGQGSAYVAGDTVSGEANFPATVGPDLSSNGSDDAFVARVNSQGTALDYCGYIGGTQADQGYGIAVDSGRNAYVTGTTASDEASFPVAVGPDLTFNDFGPWSDAFVAKVNAQGTGFEYCGYIGGFYLDCGYAIAVNGQGNAFVTGETGSDEATFPVSEGPDITHNGGRDVFVARVNAQGAGLDYCGYIGGQTTEDGQGIAVDSHGSAYVIGQTNSTGTSFPVTVGPDLTFNDFQDAFVAKVVWPYGGILAGIKANGSEGPLTIPPGGDLQVEITLDPGDQLGVDADWWLIAYSPSGWFRYRLIPESWVYGSAVSYQGPLVPVGPKIVLGSISLPAGSYTFFFGVDTAMNGELDMTEVVYDSVHVTVQ